MMKLMSDYSVAVYSAQECTLYNSNKAASLVDFSLSSNTSQPDSQQLSTIQQDLVVDQNLKLSRIIILVPDAWLSVSLHRVDHFIPSSLRPLAALSYAVETTFSPPDALMLSYQYEELSTPQSELTVFACSNEWGEQLCLPFQSIAKFCLLMPLSQWAAMPLRTRSWASCSRRALSVFHPEKEKRIKARRLCWCLIVCSLLVHCFASIHFISLHQQSAQAYIEHQQIQATQSAWSSTQNTNEFSESVLGLVQALPMSARLTYFESEGERAFLQITLLEEDLSLLLMEWRKHNPDWRWEIEQQPHSLFSPMSQKEVVDVSIEVFKS
jgi:hypothetical protein